MKQAIVVIHGIGEQHPMNTLRGFINTIVSEVPDEKKPQIWYKPNNSTELLDQRRVAMSSSNGRPSTDFYEFYWAHHVSDTKVMHVLWWVFSLLFSNPFRFPKSILFIWFLLWALLILFLSGIITGFFPQLVLFPELQAGNLMLSGLSVFIYSIVRYFLISYLGDAARYFSGNPEHVKMRNEVLQDGIQFIKGLNDNGKYDRIIIVGHSLGSVIAYDILKHLWTDYNNKYEHLGELNKGPLNKIEKKINEWKEDSEKTDIEEYQKLQEELWIQQRNYGNAWIITDLITIGSPLTHAPFLLANSKAELAVRKNDREFPTCPPVTENEKIHFYNYTKKFEGESPYFLHHAALFAITRWTNMYFPGDVVGGPLRQTFGYGIRDVKVTLPFRLTARTPLSHTKYWDTRPFSDRKDTLAENSSIKQLLAALRLDSKEMLRKIIKIKEVEEEEI